ncbi:MAG: LpxI family protein [Alphaproteobacteria bacterium]
MIQPISTRHQPVAKPLGIIAGGGPIPLMLAEQCLAQERPCFIAAITGAASADIARFPHQWIGIGAVGGLMRALRRHHCEDVVFIGTVRRPELRHLRLDWGGLQFLPRYARAALGGDDQLLRALVNEFERHGFKVVGAHEVLADICAPQGVLGTAQPGSDDQADIARALEVARQIGAMDIGQAVVVCGGVVLAVEAAEGTDAMLTRCAQLPLGLRASPETNGGKRRGVLLKLPKPGQERRIDLPAIGMTTLRLAAAAGLAGIVFEAGGALLVEVPAMIREADARGMFLLGLNGAGENS